jgi:hypothetical protein
VLWDAILFYDAQSEWRERVPAPAAWAKQVAFFGSGQPREPSGTFFRSDCKSPPVDSDWHVEVRSGMKIIDPEFGELP